jgi:hypothetical protein
LCTFEHLAVGLGHQVAHVGHGGDHRHVELALQAFLDDLHVQQAQESAAEAKAQRGAALGVQVRLASFSCSFSMASRSSSYSSVSTGKIPGPHHGLHVLETVDGLGAHAVLVGDGIAHLHLAGGLDAADDVAHIAGSALRAGG